MKSIILNSVIPLVLLGLFASSVHAQGALLRRVQQKAEEKMINEIFGESEKKQQDQNASTNDSDASTRVQNRRGTGLSQELPDVKKNIRDAGEAYEAANYIQAKSSVRTALWGLELEIGKKVLESLPYSVENLGYIENQDKVSSSGIGFLGLVIERVYQGKDDMQVKATIGNDSALLGLAGFYLIDGTYTNSADGPEQKQIQFQSQRAVIRYDEYDGYILSVPFGQHSVILVNGVNFDSESQFMSAANQFDINTIKKELGEI